MSCIGTSCACESSADDPFVEIWHIADTGTANANQAAVLSLLQREAVSALIIGGDIDYQIPHNYAATVAAFYQYWLDEGTLFPILGNHDLDLDGGVAYNAFFFDTTGGVTYYEKRFGPVHFFFLDSGFNTADVQTEPDGNDASSIQAQWLAAAASASDAPWKVVILHHAPYSSDTSHGDTLSLQWDFAGMGIDIVVAGHAHIYERLLLDEVTYLNNGMGGGDLVGITSPPRDGSLVQFNGTWGALKLRFSKNSAQITWKGIDSVIVDAYEISK